ncbi:hypothetical protein BVY01_02390 [bacterium I07]|nr:hypothetical protein BVY01_02390 [bacterium I07]
MEETFHIRFWGMDIQIHRLLDFESYIVNPEEPDSSLLSDHKIVYQPDPELEKRMPEHLPNGRLTPDEERRIIDDVKNKLMQSEIYTDILESEHLGKNTARQMLLKRIHRHLGLAQSLGDYFLYNRVDGLRLHHGLFLSNWPFRGSSVSLHAGYGLGDKRGKGEASILIHLNKSRTLFTENSLYQKLGFTEPLNLISTGNNSFTSLLYKGDYRDYYYARGFMIGAGFRPGKNMALKIQFQNQEESSARIHTKFSLFRRKSRFRPNPPISEGLFRGIRGLYLIRSNNLNLDLKAEMTNRRFFNSDFSYSLLHARFNKIWHLSSKHKLRLDLQGGTSRGSLPPQKWFDFGGRIFLNYYGHFRNVSYKAFTGDRAVSGVLTYTMKGSVFASLHLGDWVHAVKLTFWAGLGKSSMTAASRMLAGVDAAAEMTNGIYREWGMGIGDILNMFRLDFILSSQDAGFRIQFNFLQ